MTAQAETTAAVAERSAAAAWIGTILVHVGLVAIAVSTVWTTAPLAEHGPLERYMLALLGIALVAAAAAGRSKFAVSASGKLLCALGAATCMRLAVDPTLESLSGMAERLPSWAVDAYPGLATIGWPVAAIGALLWWCAGGPSGEVRPFRAVTAVAAVVLMVVAWGTRTALVAAGYDVPALGTGLIIWRVMEVGVVLLVMMSVSGERRFGPLPMLTVGLGLLGHAGRMLMGGPEA